MMTTTRHILVRETAGISRCGEIVRLGVPCARGEFPAGQPVALSGPGGEQLPCQSRVLKQWPDGSSKWILLDFSATVGAGGSSEYSFLAAGDASAVAGTIRVQPGDEAWYVDTGKAAFTIDARTFRPFTAVMIDGVDVLRPSASSCLLSSGGAAQTAADIQEITLEEAGPLRAIVRLAGRFSEKARFFCRLHFLADSSAVKIEFTLHNPAAARHRGGLWDLGDEGSLLFRSLVFSFAANGVGGETCCIPAPGGTPLAVPGASPFSLYQESSGGENWRSPVHRNHEGRVPMQRRGFVTEVNGKETSSGLRATPLVWQGQGQTGISVAVPRFWQEFPAEIAVDEGILCFSPFPARFPGPHELQGGEQKSHGFWVDFATGRDGLVWTLAPLVVHAAPEVYRESGVIYDLPGNDDLVDRFVTTKDLLAKREVADEYGWRNFGEIPADHEAVFHKGQETFVSHYNNQYDFIAGLYRKFFATGDPGWRDLAADLARHVRDIDLYHTDGDREEYNHGLFWHTDHYIDAGLSTHRSFSREHLKNKDPRFCGGGPGAEHCYTSGLMYHYFQTGNEDFRQAVLDLAQWELSALMGPAAVLAALKRGLGYVSLWRSCRGEKRLFPRHPLTRGTGNAISACIDAFEAGGGRRFLDEAERLIRDTLHPEDDIVRRDLLNAEIAWSYTVLLVAVGKYLDKKVELGEQDAGFAHARASLLVYAGWMLENEYPYLEKPEILEYPNETWVAQDLRKSVIFCQAARYADSPRTRDAFLVKARFYYEYACGELSRFPSSCYARPLVLMLQNGWVGERLSAEVPEESYMDGHKPLGRPVPYLTLWSVLLRASSGIVQAFREINIKRELAWLKARL
ncbi:RIFT barrel domain-containing protein [Pelobacter propionicus]|uniref:PcRGLX/YetA-like N-terminal RIFT barrel domain-containing protein n=1 Tax=Pelobacter propionicus (strain DSM 2379 / NBRC 103807 / OttBd1) TaxID=338966 RepID=A1ARV0_PELPD|nr:hypothetical protein [Pelobacter propionicus]ABL00071.1 hypothetical protein Ppro_2465 [Pelobacter propionicus DSM 2379]